MPSFICTKCGRIANSGEDHSTYWLTKLYLNATVKEKSFEEDFFNENPVCGLCSPVNFIDGGVLNPLSIEERINYFEQRDDLVHWIDVGRDRLLKQANTGTGTLVNAKEFFELLDSGKIDESREAFWRKGKTDA